MNEPMLVRVEDLELGEIVLDETYVQRLANNWDPKLVGKIYVKKDKDGYIVTDGTHRAAAALRAGVDEVWVWPHG